MINLRNKRVARIINKDISIIKCEILKYFPKSTIILRGSFYYDEGSVSFQNKKTAFFSDYDLFIILDYYNPLRFFRDLSKIKQLKQDLDRKKYILTNKRADLSFTWKPFEIVGIQRDIKEGVALFNDDDFYKKKKYERFRDCDLIYKTEQVYTSLLLSHPLKEQSQEDVRKIILAVIESLQIYYLTNTKGYKTFSNKQIYEELVKKRFLSLEEKMFYKRCLDKKLNPNHNIRIKNKELWFKAKSLVDKALSRTYLTDKRNDIHSRILKKTSFFLKIKNSLMLILSLKEQKVNINWVRIFNICSLNLLNKINLVNCIKKDLKIDEGLLKNVESNIFNINRQKSKLSNPKERFLWCLEQTAFYKRKNPLVIKL
ncbi:MAG: hypothetical protein KJ583_01395 [Nanoarchaeota archaeon]|nr:hypothetical protein [Nanoarchaeota archaeon]MBU1269897.1 hypothetical protein [Nanoarchaeota archaeon]MBU1603947.1 hypothetical protein [Nanoarchaeota archaeon]MBU2442564.1 hypothetical protein [Nanoarchaeota archaeon]